MNTTLLKTFGQKARTLLIDGVTRKLHYWGFDKDGNVTEQPEALPGGFLFREGVFDDPTVPHLWQGLKEEVSKEGMHEVAERAAYIWFNRLMALQILGKNGYEQPLLEPVSVEEQTPVMVKRARGGQFDFLNRTEQERLKKILTDYEKETQAFAILLIGFCHNHSLLNRVFGSIDDYTELLLPDDILSSGGFLDLLNNGGYITNEDYQQVELIGWLYQFYISEKKDQVFKKFKDGKKAEAKDIPAATQIFTPNWIVKYMVENTVGRIWLEKHPNSPIKGQMQYLVEAANMAEASEPFIEEVKDLKLLDPAAGSGHILVEGFELLYKMYLEEYYPADEAVESILEHNLYGLDIDLRAAQLAQFAVLMKAAQYYPDVLKERILPHIYAMPAPVHFTEEDVQLFLGNDGTAYVKFLQDALHLMLQAQNLGSIIQFDISKEARAHILQQLTLWQQRTDLDLLQQELLIKLTPYLKVLEVLSQQYEVIAANPPYMQSKNFNASLKKYVERIYPNGKADLFAVFLEASINLARPNGFVAEVTMQSWMFLSSFKRLRHQIVNDKSIIGLIDVGWNLFDNHSFPAAVVCFNNSAIYQEQGIYHDLTNVKVDREKLNEFWNERNRYIVYQSDFRIIPDNPIAYWLTHNERSLFFLEKIKNFGSGKKGLSTGNNDLFLRYWSEVNFNNTSIKKNFERAYWVPLNKGGSFRKWYGNNETLIFWKDSGKKLKEFPESVVRNEEYYFKPCITSGLVSYVDFSARLSDEGFIFEAGGTGLFVKHELYVLGFLSTIIASRLLRALNPTINYNISDIENLPLIIKSKEVVEQIVLENVSISRLDWDSRENSWDFKILPLLNGQKSLNEEYEFYIKRLSTNFFQLHKNEETLNSIFIQIYGLKEELDSKVQLKDVTILQEELDYDKLKELQPPFEGKLLPIKKDIPIQQLISYVIGCFMGRYCLGKSGLQIAHPYPKAEELAAYTFISQSTGESRQIEIDEDGIIPLMGSKGNLRDDAYNRLRQFLVAVWGEDTLTQNINFIQECLNQDLEDYLVKKFWSYHVRTYSKKPIYWLFSSKKGAFQALVYMHRMNRFTAEKLRDKYLLKHIQYLEQEIARMEGNMTALTKSDQKKLDQLRKDLQECNDYDLLLKDIATKQIEFDLDDGVTRNYELFKGVVAPIK